MSLSIINSNDNPKISITDYKSITTRLITNILTTSVLYLKKYDSFEGSYDDLVLEVENIDKNKLNLDTSQLFLNIYNSHFNKDFEIPNVYEIEINSCQNLRSITINDGSNVKNIFLRNLIDLIDVNELFLEDYSFNNVSIQECRNVSIQHKSFAIKSQIQELYINDCCLKHCPTLEYNMDILDLNNNYLKDLDPSINYVQQTLNVYNNFITDISNIGLNCVDINISNNRLSTLFLNNSHFKIINARNNLLTIVDICETGSKLEYLDLRDNYLKELWFLKIADTKCYLDKNWIDFVDFINTNNIDIKDYIHKNHYNKIKFIENFQQNLHLQNHNFMFDGMIDLTDPGMYKFSTTGLNSRKFLIQRNKMTIISLPSVSKIRGQSKDYLIDQLTGFTNSEINRAYGPFIYSSMPDLYDKVYQKVNNQKAFVIKGENMTIYHHVNDENCDISGIFKHRSFDNLFEEILRLIQTSRLTVKEAKEFKELFYVEDDDNYAHSYKLTYCPRLRDIIIAIM